MQHTDPSQAANGFYTPGHPGGDQMYPGNQHVLPMTNSSVSPSHPGANGARFYTIQRVNGNGGNGKGDGVPGPHKHDLAHSDNIKKNSVQREILKKEKEEKKTQVSILFFSRLAFAAVYIIYNRHFQDQVLEVSNRQLLRSPYGLVYVTFADSFHSGLVQVNIEIRRHITKKLVVLL